MAGLEHLSLTWLSGSYRTITSSCANRFSSSAIWGGKQGLRGQDRPFWGQTLGLPLHTLTLTAWENWSCSGLQYSSKVSMSPVGAGALPGLSPDTAFLHFTSSSCCNRRLGKGKR